MMFNLNIAELKELLVSKDDFQRPFVVGTSVFIRAVTHYYTGRVESWTRDYVQLSQVAWIADTGRFADAMRTGNLLEVEPYPDGWNVHISTGAIVDQCEWKHKLPREQE